jgi:hypothetical protein
MVAVRRVRLKRPHNPVDEQRIGPNQRREPLKAMTATDGKRKNLKSRRTRILAVASGGGHWVQLLRLRPAMAGNDVAFVTVNPACRAEIGDAPFHIVNDATRWNKFALMRLALRMAWIVLRRRPDVVVTTGAAPGYFAVRFGRMIGARTAWIDSMANVESLSLSGRKIGRFADLWLTQWPNVAAADGPRCEGAVL